MTVHLDTNLLVELGLNGSKMRGIFISWIVEGNFLAASSVSWSEFCNGPVTAEQRKTVETALDDRILNFSKPMAEMASFLFNSTGRRRGAHSDCMIAACAIISGAPLSTLNLKDFERFILHGLRLHVFLASTSPTLPLSTHNK